MAEEPPKGSYTIKYVCMYVCKCLESEKMVKIGKGKEEGMTKSTMRKG